MKRFFWAASVLATSKLGRCPTCMRIAFRAALASWVIAAIVIIAWPDRAIDVAASCVAGGFAVLWMAHVVTFALRSTREAFRRRALAPRLEESAAGSISVRRQFLIGFAHTLLFAAIATIAPVTAARADGCNCYTENNCYCPADAPNCFFNPATGVGYCCSGGAGCGNTQGQWCCPSGRCGGDYGTCL